MNVEWYIRRGNRIDGPFSTTTLSRLVKSGKLPADVRIRRGVDGDWRTLLEVEQLLGASSSSPQGKRLGRAEFARPPVQYAIAGLTLAVIISAFFFLRGNRTAPSVAATASALDPETVSPLSVQEAPIQLGESPPRPAVVTVNVQPKPSQSDPAPSTQPQHPPATSPGAETPLPVEAAPPSQTSPISENLPKTFVPNAPVLPEEIVPLLFPIPKDKPQIKDTQLTSFNRDVGLRLRAKTAYLIYERFAASWAFTIEQRQRVDQELSKWRERADQDLYRLGGDWVVHEKVEAAQAKHAELMNRSVTLVEAKRWQEALEALDEASRTYPNDHRAEYDLGLFLSLPFASPGLRGAQLAEDHFRAVLRRQPDMPEALNSLAIALAKQRDFTAAVRYWKRSAEISPRRNEIAQNIGRFLSLASRRRVSASTGLVREAQSLYDSLTQELGAQVYDEDLGWLHMVPVLADFQPSGGGSPSSTAELVSMGTGTGIVIAPEYVLTNRHVVYDVPVGSTRLAEEVQAHASHDNVTTSAVGKVVGVSADADLALLHIPGLTAPALSLHSQVVLDSPVIMMGFSSLGLQKQKLLTLEGKTLDPSTIAESHDVPYTVIIGATALPFASGVALSGEGGIVCMLAKRPNDSAAPEIQWGASADRLLNFLNQHLPADRQVVVTSPNPREADWGPVTEKASASIVLLEARVKAEMREVSTAARAAGTKRLMWEDFTCLDCVGQTWVKCPANRCIGGSITIRYVETLTDPRSGKPVVIQRTRKEACQNCGGNGRVSCPECQTGVDHDFFR